MIRSTLFLAFRIALVYLAGLGSMSFPSMAVADVAPVQPAAVSQPASDVRVVKDLAYQPNGGASQTLDLYLPTTGRGPLPLIILIHGGGWSGGDKSSFGGPAMVCAKSGYAVASVNYRLAGSQARFPAQLVDCKAAVRWLRAHATEYGLDAGRFIAAGHSAGSHLAAMLGVTNGDRRYEQGALLDQSSDVQAVVWTAGISDLIAICVAPGGDVWLTPTAGSALLLGDIPLAATQLATEASPVSHVTSKSAPFAIFHGDQDTLVPIAQGVEMYASLVRSGVYAELHIVKGAGHSGPGYWSPGFMNEMNAFIGKTLNWGPSAGGATQQVADAQGYATVDFPRANYPKLEAGATYSASQALAGSSMIAVPVTVESNGVAVTVDGVAGYTLSKVQGLGPRYFYFDATPDFKKGASPHLAVTFAYLDRGPETMSFVYDSSDPQVTVNSKAPGTWKSMGVVKIEGTGKWRQVQFEVNDANLAGRLNGHDFRVQWNQDVDGTIGGCTVKVIK